MSDHEMEMEIESLTDDDLDSVAGGLEGVENTGSGTCLSRPDCTNSGSGTCGSSISDAH